jgi:hypothetical protein
MKITEIENKYFFAHTGAALILESYENPDTELKIIFNKTDDEYDKKFYNANVIEQATGKKVIKITFSLSTKNSDLVIGTIEPFDDINQPNTVHTSIGSYQGGVDMGYGAMKWVQRQIKEFAKSEGFDIQQITSSTRGTGARAKNNPGDDGTGMPKNFDVSQPIKESLIYNCITDTFEIKKVYIK